MPNLDPINRTNQQLLPFDTSLPTKPLAKAAKVRADEAVPGTTDNDVGSWLAHHEDGFSAIDFVLDTYAIGLRDLPIFTIESWGDAGTPAQEAGFALGFWTAGNRPTAYSDVTWEEERINVTASANRLWAIRVPSGMPMDYVRINWVRGGQSAPQPTGDGYWAPFALTGSPKHYDIYYLARANAEFEALAVQSGDHVTVQLAALGYHDILETTADVQQGLDESLRHIHDLVDPITAEVSARGSYNPVTAGGHFRHGWANIAADGTDSSGNDHLTLHERDYVVNVAAAGARVPVVWIPIGSDPNEWRVELFRNNSAIVTYPESGEYWRSYNAARGDDVLGHYDAYFLASETSDTPVTKTWQQDDRLRLLRGAAVEAIRVPDENLTEEVQGRLLAPPTPAISRRIMRVSQAGNAWETEPEGASGSAKDERDIQGLKALTADLLIGDVATGFANAASDGSEGGIWILPSVPTLADARAVSEWHITIAPQTAIVDNYVVVRVPKDSHPSQARVWATQSHGLTNYADLLNVMTPLGSSTDNRWDYYGDRRQWDAFTTRLTLQVTASADHVGTTIFGGEISEMVRERLAEAERSLAEVRAMINGHTLPDAPPATSRANYALKYGTDLLLGWHKSLSRGQELARRTAITGAWTIPDGPLLGASGNVTTDGTTLRINSHAATRSGAYGVLVVSSTGQTEVFIPWSLFRTGSGTYVSGGGHGTQGIPVGYWNADSNSALIAMADWAINNNRFELSLRGENIILPSTVTIYTAV